MTRPRFLKDFSMALWVSNMQKNQYLSFDIYCLDVHNECVWRGKQVLHLTTKAFAVCITWWRMRASWSPKRRYFRPSGQTLRSAMPR